MKKLPLLVATLATLVLSISYAADIWELINSQFSNGKWYCTYKLHGTTVQKTVVSETQCVSVLYEQ
jgi:hypothetical protein